MLVRLSLFLLLPLLASCAGAPPPPNPIASMVRATLTPELAVTGPWPFTSDLKSLHVASFEGRDHLAVVLYGGSAADDTSVALLPARFEERPDGIGVTLLGEGGAVAFTVPALPGARIDAARGPLGGIRAIRALGGGAREVVEVDIDRSGDRARATLVVRRERAPSFGPFGRAVEEEEGPIVVPHLRPRAAARAALWIPAPAVAPAEGPHPG